MNEILLYVEVEADNLPQTCLKIQDGESLDVMSSEKGRKNAISKGGPKRKNIHFTSWRSSLLQQRRRDRVSGEGEKPLSDSWGRSRLMAEAMGSHPS